MALQQQSRVGPEGPPMPQSGAVSHEQRATTPRQLASVITDLWQHPLLTRNTIEHRQRGKEEFERRLRAAACDRKSHIDPADYIALPVGSSVWIVDQGHSDHDMMVICKDDRAKERLIETFPRNGARRDSSISHHFVTEYEITSSIMFNQQYDQYNPKLAPLFLTPDEFAAGNIERLRELRLETLHTIRQTPKATQTVWDGEKGKPSKMERAFGDHYVMWGFRQYWTDPDHGHEMFGDKRSKRLYDMLEARGRRIVEFMYPAQRRDSVALKEITAVYRSWFFGSLSKLKLPTFAEVEQELNATQGRISLIPERAAHHDLQPGQPAVCVWGDSYITIPSGTSRTH